MDGPGCNTHPSGTACQTHTYTCTTANTHTHTYTHTHTNTHRHRHTHIHMPNHKHTDTHTDTHAHTRMHTHTHLDTHAYTHAQPQTRTHTHVLSYNSVCTSLFSCLLTCSLLVLCSWWSDPCIVDYWCIAAEAQASGSSSMWYCNPNTIGGPSKEVMQSVWVRFAKGTIRDVALAEKMCWCKWCRVAGMGWAIVGATCQEGLAPSSGLRWSSCW